MLKKLSTKQKLILLAIIYTLAIIKVHQLGGIQEILSEKNVGPGIFDEE